MTAIRFLGAGTPIPAGPVLTTTGALSTVDGDEAVRQALTLLLSTSPGERLMRPQYGCHLRRLAFAANDDTTAGLAVHYVRQAIERWEPRVEIVALDATVDEERLVIRLRYQVRASLTRDVLDIPLERSAA
jgi:phage baseplate assembly protein W